MTIKSNIRVNMHIIKKYRALLFRALICVCIFTGAATPLSAEEESFKEEKTKEGFIVDLKKLLKKTKDKIAVVDDKLEDQALERRNQKRAAKAHEYYSKGMEYFEEGDFEKAEDYWEKAVHITEHPEMDGYIQKEIKKSKKQAKELKKQEHERLKRLEKERGYSVEEVEDVYEAGVKFFNRKRWLDARQQFEKVEEMFPNHKATRSYLMLVDRKIQIEQEKIIEETLRESAERAKEEKIAWRKELERKEFERRQQLEKQANDLYTEALFLYKAKRFEEAKQKFKEVEWVLPDYKKTLKYLAEIDEDIERYGAAPEEVMLEEIDDKIEEVHEQRLRRVEKEIALKKAIKADQEQKRKEEAAFLYDAAMGLYNVESYVQALEKFREVELLIPDYKSTQKYIEKLRRLTSDEDDEDEKGGIFGWFASLGKEKEMTPAEKIAEEKRLAKQRKEEAQALKEEKASFAYKAALAYYENGLMEDAVERFYEVQRMYPGYKSTEKYLTKLDPNFDPASVKSTDIQSLPLGLPFEELYREAVELYQTKKLEEARFKFNEIAKYEPDYRATQTYLSVINQNLAHMSGARISNLNEMNLIAEAEIDRDEQMFKVAENNYEVAVELYDNRNLTEAKAKFIAVEAAYPDFRDTRVFLERIDNAFNSGYRYGKDIARKSTDDRGENNKSIDTDDKDKKDKEDKQADNVKEKQVKKDDMDEENENNDGWSIFNIFKRDDGKTEEDKKAEKLKEEELEEAYERAIALYKVEEYKNARDIFEQIQLTDPNYRWAGWYLRRIGRKMEIKSELFARGIEVPEEDSPEALLGINENNRDDYEKLLEKQEKRKNKPVKKIEERYEDAYKDLQKSKEELRQKEIEWAGEILGPTDSVVKAMYDSDGNLLKEYLESEPKNLEDLKEELSIEIFKELGVVPEGEDREDAERGRLLVKIESKIEELKAQEEENVKRAHQIDMRIKAYRQQAKGMTKDMLKELKQQQKKLSKQERDAWWDRQKEIREHLADKKEFELIRQVEPLYNQARVFYEEQNYIAAREQFKLVNKLYPGYKQTGLYITKSQKKIDAGEMHNVGWNERKELEYLKKELVRRKKDEIKLKEELARTVKEEEARIRAIPPTDKQKTSDFKRQTQKLRDNEVEKEKVVDPEEEKRLKEMRKQARREIKKLYKEAVELYRDGNILDAKINFDRIDVLYGGRDFPKDEVERYQAKKDKTIAALNQQIQKRREEEILAKQKEEEERKKEIERMRKKALEEQEEIKEEKIRLEKERQELARIQREELRKKELERTEQIAREQQRKAREDRERLEKEKRLLEKRLREEAREKELERQRQEALMEQARVKEEKKRLERERLMLVRRHEEDRRRKEEERRKKEMIMERARIKEEQNRLEKERHILAQRERDEKHKRDLEKMKQNTLKEQAKIREEQERLAKEKEELEQMKMEIKEEAQNKIALSKTVPDLKVPKKEKKEIKKETKKEERKETWSERRARKRREKDKERIRAFEEREMERRKKELAAQSDTQEKSKRVTVGSISDKGEDAYPEITQKRKLNVVDQTPASLEAQIESKRREITQLLDERHTDLKRDREQIYQEFQTNLKALYHRAEMFYQQENYSEAMRLFTEIDEMEKSYMDTSRYIQNLRSMNVNYAPASSDYAVIKSTSYDTLNNRNIIVSETLDKIEHNLDR